MTTNVIDIFISDSLTAEEVADLRLWLPLDQGDALEVGQAVYITTTDMGTYSRTVTCWPNEGRAAICNGGPSDWCDQTIDEGYELILIPEFDPSLRFTIEGEPIPNA